MPLVGSLKTRTITFKIINYKSFSLKAHLHGGISKGTSHWICMPWYSVCPAESLWDFSCKWWTFHGTYWVPWDIPRDKVRGTSRVNGGLFVGLTEYYGISHGMFYGISHRVKGPILTDELLTDGLLKDELQICQTLNYLICRSSQVDETGYTELTGGKWDITVCLGATISPSTRTRVQFCVRFHV
jgi:hypothetical protein